MEFRRFLGTCLPAYRNRVKMGTNGYPVALHTAERLFSRYGLRYVNELACMD
jgi:hypothetical protein